jgi:hypothetical protein
MDCILLEVPDAVKNNDRRGCSAASRLELCHSCALCIQGTAVSEARMATVPTHTR